MKIEYDKEVDSLYITFAEADTAETREAGGGVQLDFDAGGRLVGIEVIGVSERYTKEDLTTITARNLIGAESGAG